MDPREAMQGSEMRASGHGAERRQMDQGEARHGFRPLALPALAAAARPRKPTTGDGLRSVRAIVHEDTPAD